MEQIQTLYERYKNNVYRLALSYTGHRQDAEDVTQTVVCKTDSPHGPAAARQRAKLDWLTVTGQRIAGICCASAVT